MLTTCPHCGAPARVAPNPFYGTGLAVHKTIVDCGECRRVRLVNTRQETRTAPVTVPAPKRRFLKPSRLRSVDPRTA